MNIILQYVKMEYTLFFRQNRPRREKIHNFESFGHFKIDFWAKMAYFYRFLAFLRLFFGIFGKIGHVTPKITFSYLF